MTSPGVVALLVALILAGLSMSVFVVAFAVKSPWWRHHRTASNPAGEPNTMGRALMWLGSAWAIELDATFLFGIAGHHYPWEVWFAVAVHLYVTAAGVNLLRLLFAPHVGIPTTEDEEGTT